MADGSAGNGENGNDPNLKNEGNQTPPAPNGNEDWKAKFEQVNKDLQSVTQERNLLRNQNGTMKTELEKKLNDVIAEKEQLASNLAAKEQAEAENAKKAAAQAKQNELLSKVSDRTKELVKDLGLELSDAADEEAIKTFEAKISKIEGTSSGQPPKVEDKKPQPPVGSNNSSANGTPGASKTAEQQIAEDEAKLANFTF